MSPRAWRRAQKPPDPHGGFVLVWRSQCLRAQDDGMDEATWTAAADLYNVPASERPMLLGLAATRIAEQPVQARGLNHYQLAAALVAQQKRPRTSR